MELYLKLIDVLFPVFFVIGIGYYLGKKNPNISTDFITTFAGNVGTPAMIFLYNHYYWCNTKCFH
jgi:predicted permease